MTLTKKHMRDRKGVFVCWENSGAITPHSNNASISDSLNRSNPPRLPAMLPVNPVCERSKDTVASPHQLLDIKIRYGTHSDSTSGAIQRQSYLTKSCCIWPTECFRQYRWRSDSTQLIRWNSKICTFVSPSRAKDNHEFICCPTSLTELIQDQSNIKASDRILLQLNRILMIKDANVTMHPLV